LPARACGAFERTNVWLDVRLGAYLEAYFDGRRNAGLRASGRAYWAFAP
jgi:hypothetical protein